MSDSNKFRSLRLSRAWSQEQLAELSGLSVRTVQPYREWRPAQPGNAQRPGRCI
nr:hipB family transcriptional regulator [Pantoea sp.]